MMGKIFKLVDVVDFEMLHQKQDEARDCFCHDFFVAADVESDQHDRKFKELRSFFFWVENEFITVIAA